jgi:hypothetical protein
MFDKLKSGGMDSNWTISVSIIKSMKCSCLWHMTHCEVIVATKDLGWCFKLYCGGKSVNNMDGGLRHLIHV